MTKSFWIVSYDIRNDARLRRVARILTGYGERLQYSLFRVKAGPKEIERLRWELGKVVAPEDSVLYIPVPRAADIRTQNGTDDWQEEVIFRII